MPKKLEDIDKWVLVLFFPIFVLDYILSLILTPPKQDLSEKKSVAVGDATETHGAPRRNPASPNEFISILMGNTTVYEMIQMGVKKNGDRVAMKHFQFLGMKKLKETDRFPSKIFNYDDPDTMVQVTYKQLGENLTNFGKGLREIGMEPQPPHSNQEEFEKATGKFSLVIFEDTCKEWTTAMQGAMAQSMVVATCYATLGHDAVVGAVNETQASTLFVNWKQVESFYKVADSMPTLTTIIASTHEMPKDAKIWSPPEDDNGKVQIVSYLDVIEKGKTSEYEATPPKPSDIAVIMYTSGSTGKPKGVVMKHSNLVAGLAGMVTNVHVRESQETFVSYLPLAHILALQVETILLTMGATLCYTDARQIAKTMPLFSPTIFVGVPKVWELLQGGLQKQMDKAPAALKTVFDVLLAWKMDMLKKDMDTPVSNKFFGVISTKVFGRDRIEFGVTGGGPMSASLQLFCRAVFNCPIIQGYALTETCAGGCFQATSDQRSGIVGPPMPCVEIILQSEPEFKDSGGLPYLHTDTKGAKGEAVIGRGEICFRGPSITAGYYKNKEKTAEDYDADGFFHTGDIGQFTADGAIQIVDRKKNLVKLKGGEYVAVEAMETAFATSPYVTNLCVIANGDLDGPLAIACTDNQALEKWATESGIKFDSVNELPDKPEVRKEVVRSFVAGGKEAGLGKLELRIKDCALITDVIWMPGNGLTASMKLDRKKIYDIHDKELNEMYKRNGVTISS
ncbi:chain acyl-CoA synthetase 9, chloroplastic [Seminavis robusta]|uniref:Chain acyl-CoA synthetase 9, chloroplastic n=1 Tax=Seminavis robusta TaxID=568900 RepID=A0A9N8DVV2_9STRA|nr:chain acyl-CoA synthetase 9, chloroplastic [Seminavis robusta]|eukprot:Sro394_g133910.1 chain acyl-CoA synthetase 9, chloroplastic (736) ;mRNA; r:55053-57359